MLAGALIVAGCSRGSAPPPSGQGELKVEVGAPAKLDPDAALRCFVQGKFVGIQTPAECASKNGVPPGSLDVGLDPSGALAAGGGEALQSIGNALDNETGPALGGGDEEVAAAGATAGPGDTGASDAGADEETESGSPSEGCMRFTRDGWRPAGGATTLDACVHLLFQGRCAPPGEVLYGRWGSNTLRLSPGRVEMSADNRDFHPLAVQDPDDCSIPAL